MYIDYVDIVRRSSARLHQTRWDGKQAISELNALIPQKRQKIRPKLLLMTNGKTHIRWLLSMPEIIVIAHFLFKLF